MRLDEVRLLVRLRGLLRAAQFLDQGHGPALEAPVEAAARAGVQEGDEFFGVEVEESRDMSEGVVEGDCEGGVIGVGCVERTYWSRSTPRKENLRKVLFFLSSAASSAFCCTAKKIVLANIAFMASCKDYRDLGHWVNVGWQRT